MTFRNDKAKATKSRNAFIETFKKGMIMKQRMIAKKLTVAKANCPFCSGQWHAQLVGPKKHFHMACDGCEVRMME